tara:strand:- start:46 stop:549 length:504 start_codon:yes stop_codon:yes gene_type:complete
MGVNRTGIVTSGGAYMKGHTGYGRTRRPKALTNDSSIASKETAKTVTIVESTELNDSLDDSVAGHNGYSTENQRYLHLQLTGDDDDTYSVHVYAYNYAFGAWARLYIPVKGSTAQNSWKFASFVTIDDASGGPKHITIDIAGVDRIALVATENDIPKVTARMACSTF